MGDQYCAELMKAEPRLTLEIDSYGDLGENVDVNVELAKKRGEWVVNSIVKHGGDRARIKIVSHGDDAAGRDRGHVEIWYR
jgi:outer membrane protein OmpA-like peptidoglycan-associated protein